MSDPKPLRAAINRLMHKRGYGRPGGDEALADAWQNAMAALGEPDAGTRVLKLSRRTLHIGVSDAARRSELQAFRAAALLEQLQTRHPELELAGLKFTLLRGSRDATDEPWFDDE